MENDKYLDLITSQHKTKPKFKAWLTASLDKVQDASSASNQITPSFDLDDAVGVQLDLIGEILNRKRQVDFQPSGGASPLLDDEQYRLVLKAKIAQNQWDGTIPQIQDLWQTLFPDKMLVIIDNQNMSVNLAVVGISSQMEQDLVSNGYIVPKPQGVHANYSFYSQPIFGYDLYGPTFKGYDEGQWFQASPIFSYDFHNNQMSGYDEGVWK